MSKPELREFNVGDKIETVHGEKLTVLKVDHVLLKRAGVPTGEVEHRVLVQSGDQKDKKGELIPTWLPFSKIK